MLLLKRIALSVFLGLGALSTVTVATVSPAFAATTPQEVIDLIDIRVAQLQQIRTDQTAIALDNNNSSAERIEAQSQAQQAFVRVLQLLSLRNQVPFFPMGTLDALANQLRAIISAA